MANQIWSSSVHFVHLEQNKLMSRYGTVQEQRMHLKMTQHTQKLHNQDVMLLNNCELSNTKCAHIIWIQRTNNAEIKRALMMSVLWSRCILDPIQHGWDHQRTCGNFSEPEKRHRHETKILAPAKMLHDVYLTTVYLVSGLSNLKD